MERGNPDQVVKREAARRLLAWGFSASSIAGQLHCSRGWIYAIRRERETSGAAIEELPFPTAFFLNDHDA